MKQQILAELYQSKEMEALINKMEPSHLRDEIKQELFLALCEMDDQRIVGLHLSGQLKFFVTRIVLNMVQSSSSSFYRKFRKHLSVDMTAEAGQSIEGHLMRTLAAPDDEQEVQEFEEKNNRMLEEVERVLGDLHWYNREMFKLYVHHGSAGKVIKAMKADLGGRYIPKRTILDVVKNVKTEIRQKVCVA